MGRLKYNICYLAGPIQYAADLGVNWRKEATKYLRSLDIGIIDPTDKPTEVAKEDENTQAYLETLKNAGKWNEYSKFIKEIVSVDLRFVDKSDFLLCYIDKNIYSCGTFHETAHAFLQRKPVIVFSNGNLCDIPGWIYGHGLYKMFFATMQESLEYIRHIHEDPNVDTLNRWKFIDYNKIFSIS